MLQLILRLVQRRMWRDLCDS